MSRFDLFFVIRDQTSDEDDVNIAQHIVDMHRHVEMVHKPVFSMQQLQTYIKVCRTLKP